jgi:CRISPR/Cas system CSM-associated protein Csm2 small subunit
MAFSTHQQATQEITLPVPRAHFCDADAAEFDLNKCFFDILEEMIDSLTLDDMEEFRRLFQNYFYETIDVG